MERFKISVVIPAYNIERYLSGCLDSVLAQTYKDIEVIVVNDGSKDGTGSIIDSYSQKDCRVIAIHKENGGVSSARLAGIEASTGEYIGFVDGDDYIEPDMYERLVANAVQNNADISHCGYKMIFPKGHIDYYYNTGRTVIQDNLTGLKDLIDGTFIEPGLVNKLYRREIIESFLKKGEMDYSVKINEDLLMNYYLFKYSKRSVYEDFCPYHYKLRSGSAAVSKNIKHITDPIKVKRLIYKDTERDEGLYPHSYPLYIRSLVAACGQKSFSEVIKDARSELKNELEHGMKDNCLPRNLKIMAKLAAFSPFLYRMIRKTADRIRRTDKKFSLDK